MSLLRDQVTAIARAYVGNQLGDPTFEEVTQGRAGRPGYSACGDLVNFLLDRAGCKDPSIVNRDDPGAGLVWKPGANISRPVAGAKSHGAWRTLVEGEPSPGDLVLIGQWPNEVEHVFCVLEVSGATWTSADYGQRLPEYSYAPSSGVRTRTRSGNQLGGRTIVGWIDIEAVPLIASPDLTGVPSPWPGEQPPGPGPAPGGEGVPAPPNWGLRALGAALVGALGWYAYRATRRR